MHAQGTTFLDLGFRDQGISDGIDPRAGPTQANKACWLEPKSKANSYNRLLTVRFFVFRSSLLIDDPLIKLTTCFSSLLHLSI